MSSTIIERELAENTIGALVKYARHILLFHLDGVLAESTNTVELNHPCEDNQTA